MAVNSGYDKAGTNSENSENTAPDIEIPIPLLHRLHAALGPIAGGLILDFFDLLTFGPIGIFAGVLVGSCVGWWVGGLYNFKTRGRLIISALSAIYMTIPFTAPLPLATMISAIARFSNTRIPESAYEGRSADEVEVEAKVVEEAKV
jgi:hypothetical protein